MGWSSWNCWWSIQGVNHLSASFWLFQLAFLQCFQVHGDELQIAQDAKRVHFFLLVGVLQTLLNGVVHSLCGTQAWWTFWSNPHNRQQNFPCFKTQRAVTLPITLQWSDFAFLVAWNSLLSTSHVHMIFKATVIIWLLWLPILTLSAAISTSQGNDNCDSASPCCFCTNSGITSHSVLSSGHVVQRHWSSGGWLAWARMQASPHQGFLKTPSAGSKKKTKKRTQGQVEELPVVLGESGTQAAQWCWWHSLQAASLLTWQQGNWEEAHQRLWTLDINFQFQQSCHGPNVSIVLSVAYYMVSIVFAFVFL